MEKPDGCGLDELDELQYVDNRGIRFLMPITTEDEILEEGLSIVEASLKELVGDKAIA